jgi:hypothetical protein
MSFLPVVGTSPAYTAADHHWQDRLRARDRDDYPVSAIR